MRALVLALLLATAALTQEPEFKTDVRLVEVYASVSDHRGRPLSGLTREQFRVADNGQPQGIVTFETGAADLSCAILLDTTGSMVRALPAVKNAILRFLDQLRASDSVAIYSFSTRLNMVQDFTTDKNAAKKAVLRTRARGTTALFDALSQLARDLGRRSGKKVIVVFTDGQDNASALNPAAAMERARKIGVPLYTVAQGEALNSPPLVRLLKDVAQSTGGLAYAVRQPRDIEEVFQDISNDLRHTYMLTYKAPPATGPKWRIIQVALSGVKDYKIRAREGYFPE
jgi:VWFA-related protein